MYGKALHCAKRFLRDESGAFIIEFGLTFPVLVLLSFGLLEFSLVAFDYQRAAEATRRGVRLAIIQEPIPNTTGLLYDSNIVCTADAGGAVSCTGGEPATDGNGNSLADGRFAALLAYMQQVYPTLTPENIIVVFEGTDVGDAGDSGGVFPVVTVKLRDVRHKMIVGPLIGIDAIEFPDFKASVMGNGKWVNTASTKSGNGGKN
jgi:hypothetical protein